MATQRAHRVIEEELKGPGNQLRAHAQRGPRIHRDARSSTAPLTSIPPATAAEEQGTSSAAHLPVRSRTGAIPHACWAAHPAPWVASARRGCARRVCSRPMTKLSHLEAVRRMPLMELPLRSTVIPVKSGRVLYAPASTATNEELARLGDITDIVVPNLFHTEGAAVASAVFPQARVWGPAAKPGFTPQSLLGQDPWPYTDELTLCELQGQPKFREFVLVHPASSSLILGDLAFNLLDAHGLGARIILGLFGTYRRFAVSRLFLRMVDDRAAFTRSLRALLEHDFTRVIPTHGAILEEDGREQLRRALALRGYTLE